MLWLATIYVVILHVFYDFIVFIRYSNKKSLLLYILYNYTQIRVNCRTHYILIYEIACF